jgi:hypothetical protein
MNFHVPIRVLDLVKAELLIKLLRIGRHQHPAAQILQIGMREDRCDERLAQSLPTMLGRNEDVTQVRECCLVGNDPRETNLFPIAINPQQSEFFTVRSTSPFEMPFAQYDSFAMKAWTISSSSNAGSSEMEYPAGSAIPAIVNP